MQGISCVWDFGKSWSKCGRVCCELVGPALGLDHLTFRGPFQMKLFCDSLLMVIKLTLNAWHLITQSHLWQYFCS